MNSVYLSLVLLALLSACSLAGTTEETSGGIPNGWKTYVDEEAGWQISVPPGYANEDDVRDAVQFWMVNSSIATQHADDFAKQSAGKQVIITLETREKLKLYSPQWLLGEDLPSSFVVSVFLSERPPGLTLEEEVDQTFSSMPESLVKTRYREGFMGWVKIRDQEVYRIRSAGPACSTEDVYVFEKNETTEIRVGFGNICLPQTEEQTRQIRDILETFKFTG